MTLAKSWCRWFTSSSKAEYATVSNGCRPCNGEGSVRRCDDTRHIDVTIRKMEGRKHEPISYAEMPAWTSILSLFPEACSNLATDKHDLGKTLSIVLSILLTAQARFIQRDAQDAGFDYLLEVAERKENRE